MSNAKMMDHDEMQILRESLSFNIVSDEELRKAGVYEHFALVNRWLTAKGWNHIAAFEMQGLYNEIAQDRSLPFRGDVNCEKYFKNFSLNRAFG